MTSKCPTTCRCRARRAAFTLIEILVVVTIIVLLIAITIPSVNYARRVARQSATAALLNNIGVALDAYRQAFNVYPADTMDYTKTGGPTLKNAQCLAQGLMGYLPAANDGAGPPNTDDPAFGFRLWPGGRGEIKGPYFNASSSALKKNSGTDWVFIDPFGNAIQYYLASGAPGSTITSTTITNFTGTNGVFPTLNTTDPDFLKILGSGTGVNTIQLGETALNAGSYLLVSPGFNSGGNTFGKYSIVNGKK